MVDAWITASAALQTWVDPQLHLLEDREAEKAHGFALAASYARAGHHLLLADTPVFFTPGGQQTVCLCTRLLMWYMIACQLGCCSMAFTDNRLAQMHCSVHAHCGVCDEP